MKHTPNDDFLKVVREMAKAAAERDSKDKEKVTHHVFVGNNPENIKAILDLIHGEEKKSNKDTMDKLKEIDDKRAEVEAQILNERIKARELEETLAKAASLAYHLSQEAQEEASSTEDEGEQDCDTCPYSDDCESYHESYMDEDDDEEEEEDNNEKDYRHAPYARGFRSSLPFLMPGMVPPGAMVAGPFPENEEEAKELDMLIRKGLTATLNEGATPLREFTAESLSPADPVAEIVRLFRTLSSSEQERVIEALDALSV